MLAIETTSEAPKRQELTRSQIDRRASGWLLRALWITLAAATSTALHAQEWTRFRGPNGSGISDAKTIPSKWEAENVRWRAELPGEGHSAPVLWGDRLFVTGSPADASAHEIYCLGTADGKLLWKKSYPYRAFAKHRFNSFASPTPVVDADRVYAVWAVPDQLNVAALDHAGRELWRRDLGPFTSQHGTGASPIVHDGKLILANDQDGPGFLVALRCDTGEVVWKLPRPAGVTSYSTPCLLTNAAGRAWVVFNSNTNGITAVDPADGKPAWSFADAFDKRSVSSPIAAGGLVFGSCGSGGGGNYLVAIQPPGKPGDAAAKKYELRRSAPYVPTALAYRDRLFTWSDAGVVSCLDLATGRVVWQERVGGNFFGSPVCVGGRLFCVSDTGEVAVIEAGDEFRLIARNPLNEPSHSTPAIANEHLYVRTLKHVVCIGASAVK